MGSKYRKEETIRIGDDVLVLETGRKGVCTSRPGSMFFVNFGPGEKGCQYTRNEILKVKKNKNQVDLFAPPE